MTADRPGGQIKETILVVLVAGRYRDVLAVVTGVCTVKRGHTSECVYALQRCQADVAVLVGLRNQIACSRDVKGINATAVGGDRGDRRCAVRVVALIEQLYGNAGNGQIAGVEGVGAHAVAVVEHLAGDHGQARRPCFSGIVLARFRGPVRWR